MEEMTIWKRLWFDWEDLILETDFYKDLSKSKYSKILRRSETD